MIVCRLRNCGKPYATFCKRLKSASTNGLDRMGIAIFGGITLGTFCLGLWQTQRYFWKVELIKNAQSKLNDDPVILPTKMSQSRFVEELRTKRGLRIQVKGVFDYSKEVLLGLRPAPPGLLGPSAQGMASNPLGYYVITPLRLINGNTVFVNRGWVPRNSQEWQRPIGNTEFVAVVSEPEQKNTFTPVNAVEGNVLIWLEAEALTRRLSSSGECSLRAEDVVVLEAVDDEDTALDRLPVARRARDFERHFVGPEMHAAYALTWYCLAVAGVVMTAGKFRGPRNRSMKKR